MAVFRSHQRPWNEFSFVDCSTWTLSECCVDPLRPPDLSGLGRLASSTEKNGRVCHPAHFSLAAGLLGGILSHYAAPMLVHAQTQTTPTKEIRLPESHAEGFGCGTGLEKAPLLRRAQKWATPSTAPTPSLETNEGRGSYRSLLRGLQVEPVPVQDSPAGSRVFIGRRRVWALW